MRISDWSSDVCSSDLLEATRRRGYAMDDEEHAIGLRCVAATIHDESGRPLAALSLSGPAARITDGRLQALGRLVSAACAEITVDLGGRRPSNAVNPSSD